MKTLLILLSIIAISNKKDIKYCDIKGNVKNPGVYEIKDNYTINDIIKASGGLKDNSYTNNINLSKKVTDEMVIYINSNEEINNIKKLNNCNCNPIITYKKCEHNTITSTRTRTSTTQVKNITETTSTKVTSNRTSNKTTTTKTTTKPITKIINLNECTYEDLLEINGLGPSKAEKIIEYRNTNGKFTKIEDIMNVKGIGESLFEKIKDFIKV